MKTVITFWKQRSQRLIFLVVFTVVYTFLLLLFPYILKDIIDGIKAELGRTQLLKAIMLLGIIGILRSTAGVFLPYCRGRTNEIFNLRERNNIFETILKQGQSFFNRFPAGDILERMDMDLGELSWFSCSGIFRPLEGFLTICFAVYFLSRIDWRLMLIALVPMSTVIFVFTFFAPRVYRYFKKWREIISSVHNILQTNFTGIRIVKAYTMEEQNAKEFRKLLNTRIDAAKNVYRVESLLQNIFLSIEEIGLVLVLLCGGIFILKDSLTIGEFVAFMAYILILLHPIIDIANFFVIKKRAEVQVKRLEQIKNYPPDVNDTGEISNVKDDCISIQDLSFAYNENTLPVLNNINLRIPVGKKIGIAGTVGSGKSTLLRLIMRIAEPSCGKINLNGFNIKEINLSVYRKLFSYAPQEPSLFSDTIYNNINFGREIENEKMERVVEICQLKEFINNCPKGYDELIGERGLKLSGGEKQRIAIARAILGQQKILILDDATSNLDAETEKKLIEEVARLQSMTIILVSHRLSILAACDYIYVLHHGKIVEEGTPDLLIKKRGLYWKLYRYQLEENPAVE